MEILNKDNNVIGTTAKPLAVVPPKSNDIQREVILPNPEIITIDDSLFYSTTDSVTGEVILSRIGRKIEITSSNCYLEDNKITFEMKIHTKKGVVTETDVSRLILTNKEELFKTVEKGSDVNNSNYKYYWMSLQNQDEELRKLATTHRHIGWDMYEGKTIYKHEEVISHPKIESTYAGDLWIKTGGTSEEYCKFLKEEVIGNTPLESIVAMGLSSVVVGLLDEANPHLFHLYGDSTTGKTTAGELLISLCTQPTMQKEGLMISWNSTSNALIGKVRNMSGVPFLIDDSSASSIQDFSSIIYQLTSGRDKNRLTKESEIRKASNWKINIFSTGENSLLNNSNQNEGLKVRASEFANVGWTNNAGHADRIKEKVQRYYGHGVIILAKRLQIESYELIEETLQAYEEEARMKLEKSNKKNSLTDRKLKPYSYARLAIDLFEDEVKLGFNMERISDFLIEHMFSDERPMWKIALEELLSYIESNDSRFNKNVLYDLYPDRANGSQKVFIKAKSYNSLLGIINDVKIINKKNPDTETDERYVVQEITILKTEVNKILKELNFTNPTSILKHFKDNNITDCEADRLTRKRKISEAGGQVSVVVIQREKLYEENAEARNEYLKEKSLNQYGENSQKEVNNKSLLNLKGSVAEFEEVDLGEKREEEKEENIPQPSSTYVYHRITGRTGTKPDPKLSQSTGKKRNLSDTRLGGAGRKRRVLLDPIKNDDKNKLEKILNGLDDDF